MFYRYGDFYPQSMAGRFVGVITVCLGTVIAALLVTAVMDLTRFSNSEATTRRLIAKGTLKKAARNQAARVVVEIFRLAVKIGYKQRMSSSSKFEPINPLKHYSCHHAVRKWRSISDKIKVIRNNDTENPHQILMARMGMLEGQLDLMKLDLHATMKSNHDEVMSRLNSLACLPQSPSKLGPPLHLLSPKEMMEIPMEL